MVRPLRSCILAPILALAPLGAQEPSIRLVDAMDFGILLVDPLGGMIALTELGALVPTGPGVQPRAGAPAQAARFQLQGKPGAPFSLRLSPSTPFLEGPRGSRIPLTGFLCRPASLTGTFDAEGQAEVRLGGRLDLRADLPAGAYLAPLRLELQTLGAKGPTAVSQTFPVKARLQGTFKLTCIQDLDFGVLLPGFGPGSFEVKPTGGYQRLGAGGPTLLRGLPQPAVFLLEGQAGAEYSLQVPAQITLAGPGRPITVSEFRLDTGTQGTLLQGALRFGLGGRIQVPPDQASGSYRGVLHVTVAYP